MELVVKMIDWHARVNVSNLCVFVQTCRALNPACASSEINARLPTTSWRSMFGQKRERERWTETGCLRKDPSNWIPPTVWFTCCRNTRARSCSSARFELWYTDELASDKPALISVCFSYCNVSDIKAGLSNNIILNNVFVLSIVYFILCCCYCSTICSHIHITFKSHMSRTILLLTILLTS